MTLTLYNTLTRREEEFKPMDAANVRMYVCGPTVYDRAHLGNARSVVVYDVLYRLLRHIYGPDHVTYVRNITDVDDKINAAAKARGITIRTLTEEVTRWFHDDMAALGVLPASGRMIEPKATDHIAQMIAMIERLLANGNAYVAQDHVLFAVKSMLDYGALSGRVQEELASGARVKVESYKRDPNDFVLWKPADGQDDPSSIFDSPWGKGRPGWHIECSAMSTQYLGPDFDIHGGGADLMFPHHENEIAQSRCAAPGSHFARFWVHNGFLTVNGEKMSKSLGNFITVRDLLNRGVKGEVIRFALLSAQYNEPLDWTEKLLNDAQKTMDYFYNTFYRLGPLYQEIVRMTPEECIDKHGVYINNNWISSSLMRNLGTASAIGDMHNCASLLNSGSSDPVRDIKWLRLYADLLGILQQDPEAWQKGDQSQAGDIDSLIHARNEAKKAKNWPEADRIRNELKSQGIILEDRPDGTTDWRRQ